MATTVIFRKYKDSGDILALFPYNIETMQFVACYEHVGQHGIADYHHCISTLTVPATNEESADLKAELEGIGYVLIPRKKMNYLKWLAVVNERHNVI